MKSGMRRKVGHRCFKSIAGCMCTVLGVSPQFIVSTKGRSSCMWYHTGLNITDTLHGMGNIAMLCRYHKYELNTNIVLPLMSSTSDYSSHIESQPSPYMSDKSNGIWDKVHWPTKYQHIHKCRDKLFQQQPCF
jgi:hypothetical protein